MDLFGKNTCYITHDMLDMIYCITAMEIRLKVGSFVGKTWEKFTEISARVGRLGEWKLSSFSPWFVTGKSYFVTQYTL